MFDVVPDIELNAMRENQSLSQLTGRILAETDKIIEQARPDMLIVQGDTTTVFGAALAGY